MFVIHISAGVPPCPARDEYSSSAKEACDTYRWQSQECNAFMHCQSEITQTSRVHRRMT